VRFDRPGRDLDADTQRLDGLLVAPRVAQRGRVGQDAGDLPVGPRRGRGLAHLFGRVEPAVDDHVGVVRAKAAAKLDRLLVGLDVALADVFVRGRRLALRRIAARARRRRNGGDLRGRGLRGRHRGPAGEALHALVVRRELHQLRDEVVKEVVLAGVARDARHLFLDFDGLGGLPDLRERAGEEAESVEIARVRLEAHLELRERLHPVVRGVAREVDLGGGARLRRVGLVVEEPLDDLERVFFASELRELARGDSELAHGAVDVFRARERLGEAQVRQRVGRVEVDDAAEDFDGLLVAVLALQARGHFVERRERVARQTELLIELGELRRDVRVPILEGRHVARDDLADLLVDGDRLEREALRRIEFPDPLVGRHGGAIAIHLELEVAHLQEGPSVVRIFLDDPLVLDHRLVVLLLLDVLLGGGEHLFAVNRHDSECSSDSGTALDGLA
jgi:hypothetical protein